MPYVAEQLGDTPSDAQAIARFFWDEIYPLDKTLDARYWSPTALRAVRSTCTCPARPPGPEDPPDRNGRERQVSEPGGARARSPSSVATCWLGRTV